MANRCDVKLENYPTAIAWFENMIQNPPSLQDSVYAIIDLENTYLRMQNSGDKASNYIGTMPEFKPKSEITHVKHTNYLLSLLNPSKQSNSSEQKLATLRHGQLLQNNPNPFSTYTQIQYKLEKEALVQVNIYNNMGQLVKTFNKNTQSKGVHSLDFDAATLPGGMYFYSIIVNGHLTDSKKMMIR